MWMRPKRPCVDGLAHALQRRVEPVLLDHEQLHASVAAAAHHRHAFVPLGGHGLLGQHMAACGRHLHAPAAGAGRWAWPADDVGIAAASSASSDAKPGAPVACMARLSAAGSVVAHGHQLGTAACMALQRLEVTGTDAPAADQRKADAAVGDGQRDGSAALRGSGEEWGRDCKSRPRPGRLKSQPHSTS
jgi:hypothetical protein